MTDQQLSDFRQFVEGCEIGRHRSQADSYLADLLRPVLDEIDHQRQQVRKLREELQYL